MAYSCCDMGNKEEFRSFLTKKEKAEILKDYKDSLEKEMQGVSERIKELEKN